jgi:hypothetical protein
VVAGGVTVVVGGVVGAIVGVVAVGDVTFGGGT